jgi:hypothetical protein
LIISSKVFKVEPTLCVVFLARLKEMFRDTVFGDDTSEGITVLLLVCLDGEKMMGVP